MGWAEHHVRRLKAGETVQFRPRGNSMSPRIRSGQLVTVVPITLERPPEVGDVVLCRVHGNTYLHLVAKKDDKGCCLITNNKNNANGWTRIIYGRVVKVEP